ncbi:MAG TPA: glycosyltransferase family 4 protein [Thiobacillus sp.]
MSTNLHIPDTSEYHMPNRILLVTPASPFSSRTGAEQRTALLYEALKSIGDVDVLLLEATSGKTQTRSNARGVVAHEYWVQHPFGINKFRPDNELSQTLASQGVDLNNYTLIVGRYINPICKLHIPNHIRTVVDLDDWSYSYHNAYFRWAARVKSLYIQWVTSLQFARFDSFFFVSKRDQAHHPTLHSTVLPNIPFISPKIPFPPTKNATLLFVGSLWYGPNRQGVDHFLKHCWPHIKFEHPNATLLLAGAAPEPVRSEWEKHAGVCAPGYVEDLSKIYRDAAFTIAPLYYGGGSNIKILESVAYGRACISTPHSVAAFQPELGMAGIGLAHSDKEFIKLCLAWLDDPAKRNLIAKNGYSKLVQHYTRTLFFERVREICSL